MKEERHIFLINYTAWIYGRNISYDYIGRSIKHVCDFLEKAESVTRKGFLDYKRNYAEAIIDPIAQKAICDMLALSGVGFRKIRKKESNVIPLEKLEIITERNKKLINDFLIWLHDNTDHSENTYRIYHDSLKSYFGHTTDFCLEEAKRYIKTMEDKGFAPSTIRLRITALEKFGEWMKKPIKLKRPKFQRKLQTENIPTEEEYNRLLSFLSERGNKIPYFQVKTLATTGARVSEFLQFQWQDVINGEVTIKGKGNKYRKFFFSKSLQREVSDYIKETGISGLIAVGRYGKITKRGFDENLKNWGANVGIDKNKMHAHAFRHFFAKMYLKKTKDVIQLAEILGHGSINTTRIYLQKSNEEQKRDFNKNVNW